MKITCIGCGNAFSKKLFNQSFILEEKGRKLLFDCGSKIPMALCHYGIDVSEIDDIYISHLHADHIGGLEEVALSRFDWGMNPIPRKASEFKNLKAPQLICEKKMMKELWKKSLSGGLECMEGFKAGLETFFLAKPVERKKSFKWMGWDFELVKQVHIVTDKKKMDTYGLFISKKGKESVYFTSDTRFVTDKKALGYLERADFIFHDCELSPFVTNVHANYIQLAGLDENINLKLSETVKSKIKLIHYQDFKVDGKKMVLKSSPCNFYKAPEKQKDEVGFVDFNWDSQAKKDGFKGFINPGEVFKF